MKLTSRSSVPTITSRALRSSSRRISTDPISQDSTVEINESSTFSKISCEC
jgi:hypothetical protein